MATKAARQSKPTLIQSLGANLGSLSSESQKDHADDTSHIKLLSMGAIPSDETDGREVLKWESRYPDAARKEINQEALVGTAILFLTLASIFVIWSGLITQTLGCTLCEQPSFLRYSLFFLGGVLGGAIFSIKYLYRVVARGYWHQDRRLWRLLSPLLTGSLSLLMGAITDAGLLGLTISTGKPAGYLAIGFITGYLGDKLLSKIS